MSEYTLNLTGFDIDELLLNYGELLNIDELEIDSCMLDLYAFLKSIKIQIDEQNRPRFELSEGLNIE